MSHKSQDNGLLFSKQGQQENSICIGVISDTHIPDQYEHIPKVVLDAFKQVDLVIHAGDMVSLGVIDELKSVCVKVVAVAGNMDQDAVKKKYPVKQVLDILSYRLGVMHGAGSAFNLLDLLKDAFKEDNCDLIIFGHSHKPMNEKIGRVLFFNPGSATDRTAEYNSYGIIELKKRLPHLDLASESQGKVEARVIKI